jgi:threonine dehydrogenase-like Zn-dependent dehydrogenase
VRCAAFKPVKSRPVIPGRIEPRYLCCRCRCLCAAIVARAAELRALVGADGQCGAQAAYAAVRAHARADERLRALCATLDERRALYAQPRGAGTRAGSGAAARAGSGAAGLRVMVVGAGPAGLRTAIEAALCGCATVTVAERCAARPQRFAAGAARHLRPTDWVVLHTCCAVCCAGSRHAAPWRSVLRQVAPWLQRRRSKFTRHNLLHLWAWTLADLKAIGARAVARARH